MTTSVGASAEVAVVTALFVGSTRVTVPSILLAVQTESSPAAIATGSSPAGKVATSSFVLGSMRCTESTRGRESARRSESWSGRRLSPPVSEEGWDGCGGGERERDEPDSHLGSAREAAPAGTWRGDAERLAGLVDQLAAGWLPLVGLLGESLGRAPESTAVAGRDWLAGGRRRVLEVGEEGGHHRLAAEGRLAREALVEDTGERVEVGAPVDRLPTYLFGGDVVGRAGEVAALERARRGQPARRARSRPGRRARGRPGSRSSTLAGLTSRCTSPCSWATSSASAT